MDDIDLWHRITATESLMAAWARVLANGGGSGGDGSTLDDFGSDLYANIIQLRAELLGGTWRGRPYRKVAVPKRKPGYRLLTIPSIRDRVVHGSIAAALTPIMEAVFEDSSFAYRPNRGVTQAVERIEFWHRHGYEIVIEADIVSYFDNIDHTLLMEKLTTVIGSLSAGAAVVELVRQIVDEQGNILGSPGRGLAQGSSLSPLLANLYLDALDEEIAGQGVKLVRFADDFVILCKSVDKAERVLEHCAVIIAAHGLQLHADGTRIVSFDKGFDFIGNLFLKTLALKEAREKIDPAPTRDVKLAVSDDGVIALGADTSRYDPGHRTLYLLDPQNSLGRRNQSFSVLRDDGSELIALNHERVGRIEIGPGVRYDCRAVDLAISHAVDVTLIDGFGQTRGLLSNGDGRRYGLHLSQARAVLDDKFRTAISQRLIDSRILNQRAQLMRLNRERTLAEVDGALVAMQRALSVLPNCKTVSDVFGLEGRATARYWPALGALMTGQTAPFVRSRPARDPLNATINYLTGILERDVRASIQRAGLVVGFAFLHGSRDRHDGLVFDLMEPFRAPLSEGLAIFLFNSKRLRSVMFNLKDANQVLISSEGRAAIVQGYESAVSRRVKLVDSPKKLSWRNIMYHQGCSLGHATSELSAELFQPYIMTV